MKSDKLYHAYIQALLFLRNFHLRFLEPMSIDYFRIKVQKEIIILLIQDGMAEVFQDYYKEDDGRLVSGISITFKGLWRAYKEVGRDSFYKATNK
jgi:hypothetical protein